MLRPPGPVVSLCLSGWLLLQAPRWVVQEGESIRLRCHTWKNITIQKVQYFQNGMGKKFSHQNFEYHIPNATLKDGGSYFCRGIIKNYNLSSEAVKVTVQGKRVHLESSEACGGRGKFHPHWEDELGGHCWPFHRLLYMGHSLCSVIAGAEATFLPQKYVCPYLIQTISTMLCVSIILAHLYLPSFPLQASSLSQEPGSQ